MEMFIYKVVCAISMPVMSAGMNKLLDPFWTVFLSYRFRFCFLVQRDITDAKQLIELVYIRIGHIKIIYIKNI